MSTPKFTVVIPAYNGGAYLRQCVRSVLAQTYSYFELVILDDGSTDGSLDWLSGLGEPRLTIIPAPEHLGIVRNWGRIRGLPKAEFMTILGQDDLLDSNYLAVMDALTRRHPDAGLYHAHFRFIGPRGRVMRACRPMPARETAAEYLAALFSQQRDTYGTGYLMRSARYESVGGIPAYEKLLFADDALWLMLMEGSWKATAAEECFSCRLHAASTGGGTGWQSWLAAMPSYVAFLQALAARDPASAAAYAAHAPGYFLHWERALYTLALVRATRRNQRVEPTACGEIRDTLLALAPRVHLSAAQVETFDAGRGFRVREWINLHRLTRLTYNAYVRLRYRA